MQFHAITTLRGKTQMHDFVKASGMFMQRSLQEGGLLGRRVQL